MARVGSNSSEFTVDISALQAIRQGRIEFVERLIEASVDRSEATLAALRNDATYQLAEFLFLLRGFGISTVDDIDAADGSVQGAGSRRNLRWRNAAADFEAMGRRARRP